MPPKLPQLAAWCRKQPLHTPYRSKAVAVLCDVEYKMDASLKRITEIAAASLVFDGDNWNLSDCFAAFCESDFEYSIAAHDCTAWLRDLLPGQRGAGAGVPIFALAHNGHANDWPLFEHGLKTVGLTAQGVVTSLDCSRGLFVAEKKAELGPFWSMENIYAERFHGEKIPNQHTAMGDVDAMVRIFKDVEENNGAKWIFDKLRNSSSAKQPDHFTAKIRPQSVRQSTIVSMSSKKQLGRVNEKLGLAMIPDLVRGPACD